MSYQGLRPKELLIACAIAAALLTLAPKANAGYALPTTPSKVPLQAIEGAMEQNLQRRGFAQNDPRYVQTLSGGTIALVANVAGTAVGAAVCVGTVGTFCWAGLLADTATTVAVGGGLYWAFGPNGVAYTYFNDPYSGLTFGQEYVYFLAHSTQVIPNASTITIGDTSPTGAINGWVEVAGLRQTRYTNLQLTSCSRNGDPGTVACTLTAYDTGFSSNVSVFVSVTGVTAANRNTQQVSCTGGGYRIFDSYTGQANCSTAAAPTLGGSTSSGGSSSPSQGTGSIADAASYSSPSIGSASIPDTAIAAIANKALQSAAQSPDYRGLPYDYTQPVTSADVAASRNPQPNPITKISPSPAPQPKLDDFLAPVPNNNGAPVSSTNPLPTPTPNSNTTPAPSTGDKNQPELDLGPDPGIAYPGLEDTPTPQSILDPLLQLFPDLKGWQMPSHTGVCPTVSFTVSFIRSAPFVMDAHCPLMEDHKQALYNAAMLCWLLLALFIFMGA